MSEQITTILKKKLEDLTAAGSLDAETRINVIKEELQYYVLNFIYHHPKYNSWIMYGGSTLRIIHGLDRMSVDLDFEIGHKVKNDFWDKLKKEIEKHFYETYNAGSNFLTAKITNRRGLTLKFRVGKELVAGYSSEFAHVKIDLNHFVAPKTVTERRPINRNQLSFVILTYNMGALMASKLAAIFLRGTRGVGKAVYEEKGRDIYDLLWYMDKKAVPDFDYLIAKGIDVKDPRTLFDKLTLQINKVSDKNLKYDLEPLFTDKIFIGNWLKNWRESYLRLLEKYEIRTIKELERINIHQDFHAGTFSFVYWYATEDSDPVRIIYRISDYWMRYREGDLYIETDKNLDDITEFTSNVWSNHPTSHDKLDRYKTLFRNKTDKYFKTTNGVMLGDTIITKVIRLTADNLNQKEQIVLNKSALMSCELDDLLK